MTDLPLSYIRSQFEALGYGLTTEIHDPLWSGRAKYQTYPLAGGSHGFFVTKLELVAYLEQVKKMREG